MFSERRCAQIGLMLACLLFVGTLAILFVGGRQTVRVGQQLGVTAVGAPADAALQSTGPIKLASSLAK